MNWIGSFGHYTIYIDIYIGDCYIDHTLVKTTIEICRVVTWSIKIWTILVCRLKCKERGSKTNLALHVCKERGHVIVRCVSVVVLTNYVVDLTMLKTTNEQYKERVLGIIGWDPSVSKSNRLHVDIFRLFFANLRCILLIPLKWWVIFLKSWTSIDYFSNWTNP